MTLRSALNRLQSSPNLGSFLVTDMDEGATVSYFGYTSLNGAWMIKKLDTSAGTVLYAFGTDDYDSSWATRASLAYTTPHTLI